MNSISRLSSYTASIFGRTSHFVSKTSLHQCCAPPSKGSFQHAALKAINLEFLLARLRVQCYSSRTASAAAKASRKKKSELEATVMEGEKDAFFVVRKGDVVGVYKNFSDCQAQVGSSISDPPVSIYKGYSLPKSSEAYLCSQGLQNAPYTIRAADLKEDLFGILVPYSFQQPAASKGETYTNDVVRKRPQEVLGLAISEADGSTSFSTDVLRKHVKMDNQAEDQGLKYDSSFCVLEFDGASKGNPGRAGAGAVLRTRDGRLICRLQEGLGKVTNNVAEYRAMILGLKYALKKGYTKICVKGDSKLVCMQIQGLWKVKHENISSFYQQAEKLRSNFLSFQISHVLRKYNAEADAQANLAVKLADGQVQEEFG